MNKDSIFIGIIGLLLGVIIAGYVASNAVNTNNTGMMRMMGMRSGNMMEGEENPGNISSRGPMGMGSSMEEMEESMLGKKGDEFDKAFIAAMIIHHQGAIDMARKAQAYAQHDEIRQLADDIISAQTSEIQMMQEWQKTWGY